MMGSMLSIGLITPHSGVRYHLRKYSSRNLPQNHRELFDLHYTSIALAFGILKKWFVIISNASDARYGVKAHNSIILACEILHNYLMSVDHNENLRAEVNTELARQEVTYDEYYTNRSNSDDAALGECLRD